MSARALFTEWLTFLASEKRASPRTVRAYGDDVERWLDFLMRHLGTAPDAEALKTLSAGDLRAFLADKLGKHELPTHLEFRDSLPKTAVGKLSKKELIAEEREKHKTAAAG